MLVIVGLIVVLGSVLLGYTLHGGHVGVLIQPTELIIIGGAAVGTIIASSPASLLKEIAHQLSGAIKKKETGKAEYTEVLMLLYEIFKTGKGNMLALEPHMEKPDESAIFKKYPFVLMNHHAVHFIADTMKIQISSPVSPYDLEDLMDADIKTAHASEFKAVATISRVGDAMPGLGIVAAVLGVVITMGKLTEGKEVIGHSVAAALVGTFLGILLAYGVFQPVAAKIELNIDQEGKVMEVIKAGILAFSKDCAPKVCVEFARRTIPPFARPDFEEVDSATQNVKAAA